MPNDISLAKTYVNNLDEIFRNESYTNDLTGDPTMIRAGANAKEIIYPQLSVGGLGDYDRNAGYTTSAVSLKWKTAEYNYDRGARILVDYADDAESLGLAFGSTGAALVRECVVPEADAFTFATLAGKEGISRGEDKKFDDGESFLKALVEAKIKMDEDEVPEEERYLYATPTLFDMVMSLDTTKSREILSTFAKKKAVPQSRFYTAIDLLDARSEGEEAGHYRKAEAGKKINFMIIHKPAIIKHDKHIASNIIMPENNDSYDGYIIKYRKYGIVDVYDNKKAGIYLSAQPAE